MSDSLLRHILLYGIDGAAILVTIVVLAWQSARRSWFLWTAAGLLAIAFLGRTVYFLNLPPEPGGVEGGSFKHMWLGGSYALQGKDPYTVKALPPPNEEVGSFLYPPSALPLFKLFALAPFWPARQVWIAMNILICLGLGLLTRQTLAAQDHRPPAISLPMAALLTAPVILSLSGHFSMEATQCSFLVTFGLLGALAAQASEPPRPVLAGAFLALASIKPQTVAPFLILFLRRRDIRTWLSFCILLAILLLLAGNPVDLPKRFTAMLQVNAAVRAPGKASDFSLLNWATNSLVGFEHMFGCLGVANRSLVTTLGAICTIALGVLVFYLVKIKGTFSPAASCALVSLYSMLFVYHRLYDLCILIIPLFYSVSRLDTPSRSARLCHAWVITAILLCLNAPYGEFLSLRYQYPSSVMVRVLVLPSVTYLLLSALLTFATAVSLENRYSAMRPASTKRPKPAAVLAGQEG